MPVALTTVTNRGSRLKAVDVVADADGDTTATIPHGIDFTAFGANDGARDAYAAARLSVHLTPKHSAAAVSGWFVSAVDRTNVVLTKGTGAGSGNAAVQVRCEFGVAHSIVR
jgi:hypothetical protein